MIPSLLLLSVTSGGSGLGSADPHVVPAVDFIPNQGQWASEVKFVGQSAGLTVPVYTDGFGLDWQEPISQALPLTSRNQTIRGHRVRVRVLGEGTPSATTAVGTHRQLRTNNFMLGSDRSRWRQDVPTYGGVNLNRVANGVDLRLVPTSQGLRFDLVLAPNGSTTRQVTLRYEGVSNLRVSADGSVTYDTSLGPQREQSRFAFTSGTRQPRAVQAERIGQDQIRYTVREVPVNESLVLDPIYRGRSTYFAPDPSFRATDMQFTSSGEFFVLGTVLDGTYVAPPGAYETNGSGDFDMLVLRVDQAYRNIRTATYIGSDGAEFAQQLAVLPSGSIIVAGNTSGNLWANGFQPTIAGENDLYFIRLTSDLRSAIAATYYGGLGDESEAINLRMAPNGSVTFTSTTSNEAGMPVTPGTKFSAYGGNYEPFFAMLSPGLDRLRLAGFYGGPTDDFAVGLDVTSENNLVVAANTESPTIIEDRGLIPGAQSALTSSRGGYAVRLRRDGSDVASTYFPATGESELTSIALTNSGSILLLGGADGLSGISPSAWSPQPTPSGTGYAAALSRLDSRLQSVQQATYLTANGSTTSFFPSQLLPMPNGQILVLGTITDGNFPLVGPGLPFHGQIDLLAFRLNANLSTLVDSTYLGGSRSDFGPGRLVLNGSENNVTFPFATESLNVLTTPQVYQSSSTVRSVFLQEIAFHRDPIEFRAKNIIMFANSTLWSGVRLNGAAPFPVTMTLRSLDPTVAVPEVTTLTIPANSNFSPAFRIRSQNVTETLLTEIHVKAGGTEICMPVIVFPNP